MLFPSLTPTFWLWLLAAFILGIVIEWLLEMFFFRRRVSEDTRQLQVRFEQQAEETKARDQELADSAARANELEAHKNNLSVEINDLQASLQNETSERATLQKQYSALQADLKSAQSERANLQTRTNQLQVDLQALQASQSGLGAELKQVQADRAKLTAQLDECKRERARLAVQLDNVKAAHADLAAQLQPVKADHAKLVAQLEQVQAGHANLVAQRDESDLHRANLAAQLDQVKAANAKLTAELGQVKESHATLAHDLTQASAETAAAMALVETLNGDKTRLENELQSVRQETEARNTELAGLKTLLENTQQELAVADTARDRLIDDLALRDHNLADMQLKHQTLLTDYDKECGERSRLALELEALRARTTVVPEAIAPVQTPELATPGIAVTSVQAELPTPEITVPTVQAELPTPEVSISAVELKAPEITVPTVEAELPTAEVSVRAVELTTPAIAVPTTEEKLATPAIAITDTPETVTGPQTRTRVAEREAGDETPYVVACPQHLSDVKGIGSVFEQRLYAAGVGSFWELANLTDEELTSILALTELQKQRLDMDEIRADALQLAEATNSKGRGWAGQLPDDLEPLEGIGATFEKRLYDAGICTYAALAKATVEQLDQICKAPAFRKPNYQSWIDQARALLAKQQR